VHFLSLRTTRPVCLLSRFRITREGVQSLLSRAVRDPLVAQQLRAGLASSSQGRAQIFRLNNREVRQIVDLVVRGEIVLAPSSVVTLAPKKGKAYKHGDRIGDPVKFDKTLGKWVEVWPITATPDPDEGGKAPSDFEINKTGTKLTPITTGPEVAKLLLDTLEEIEKEVAAAEKEQQDTAKLQKED
jgi:hypothetical protein